MKILYAIQGTGNGHLSRAREIIPNLKQHAKVEVLISGTYSELKLPFPVKYRLQGMDFRFGRRGGVSLLQTLQKGNLRRFMKEVRTLPVEDYDLIISDFEPVSAWACRMKGKPCIGLSNQAASLAEGAPRARTFDPVGRAMLKYYAPVTANYGFHFQPYNQQITTPVIQQAVRALQPEDQGHYTVYLPDYDDKRILRFLEQFPLIKWQVFSKHSQKSYRKGNIHVQPMNDESFLESLRTCRGIFCASGFATPSEALYLHKKLMVIPMKGQYEQQCNASALQQMGVAVIRSLGSPAVKAMHNWLHFGQPVIVDYSDNTAALVEQILRKHAPGTLPEPVKAAPKQRFSAHSRLRLASMVQAG